MASARLSGTMRTRANGAQLLDEPKTELLSLRGFTVRHLDGNLIAIAHEVRSPLGRDEDHDLSPERRVGH